MELRRLAAKSQSPAAKASDALPLPLHLTNIVFFTLFFSIAYYLLHHWRDKLLPSSPISAVAAIVALTAAFIYLLGFFGIHFVRSLIPSPSPAQLPNPPTPELQTSSDADIVAAVVAGDLPSHSLESLLSDCFRAAAIRREAVQRLTGRSLGGLPLEGFEYGSILGQCCEMPVGFVQVPVGVVGPLLLDGEEHTVPMATTEGCLVASTNRGCKAIFASGGASSVVLKDGMSRAPVVRFATAGRAVQLKLFLEDPLNFDTLSVIFNRSLSILHSFVETDVFSIS